MVVHARPRDGSTGQLPERAVATPSWKALGGAPSGVRPPGRPSGAPSRAGPGPLLALPPSAAESGPAGGFAATVASVVTMSPPRSHATTSARHGSTTHFAPTRRQDCRAEPDPADGSVRPGRAVPASSAASSASATAAASSAAAAAPVAAAAAAAAPPAPAAAESSLSSKARPAKPHAPDRNTPQAASPPIGRAVKPPRGPIHTAPPPTPPTSPAAGRIRNPDPAVTLSPAPVAAAAAAAASASASLSASLSSSSSAAASTAIGSAAASQPRRPNAASDADPSTDPAIHRLTAPRLPRAATQAALNAPPDNVSSAAVSPVTPARDASAQGRSAAALAAATITARAPAAAALAAVARPLAVTDALSLAAAAAAVAAAASSTSSTSSSQVKSDSSSASLNPAGSWPAELPCGGPGAGWPGRAARPWRLPAAAMATPARAASSAAASALWLERRPCPSAGDVAAPGLEGSAAREVPSSPAASISPLKPSAALSRGALTGAASARLQSASLPAAPSAAS
mmetsp:Transcript_11421/g.44170  ORF Transcript_11421/g.44170 Transcript_11421/m.44170 type:complete len:515 (+) Transcript_11421:1936-3480(+)